jgi:hypothetical protein
MYQERIYRSGCTPDLKKKVVVEDESDLLVFYTNTVEGIESDLKCIRSILKNHIDGHTEFLTSLKPVRVSLSDPDLIQKMKKASALLNVGPMASVAGAVSNALGSIYADRNPDLIIENGGDLYVKTSCKRHILIHAGDHPLSDKIALEIVPEMGPVGICTSSGRLGHSLSFGNADAVVAVSPDPLLADATATAIGNLISSVEDIQKGIDTAKKINNLTGILILCGDSVGIWGDLKISRH